MNVLAVDTSSDHGSAVVQIGDTLAAEICPGTPIQYSEHLFATIDALFGRVDITLDDIDLFAAVRGPGSFTGLRVGLATMDGLAYATRKAACGVSSLAALAWQAGTDRCPIVPFLDARRGEIYAAVYRREAEELVEVSAPAVLQPAEWLESLPEGPTVFCGDTGTRAGMSDAIADLIDMVKGNDQWDLIEVRPRLAGAVARMVASSHREPLEPMYLRRTSAELNRPGLEGGR